VTLHRITVTSPTGRVQLDVPPEAERGGIPLAWVSHVYIGGASRYPADRWKVATKGREKACRRKKG